MDRLRRNRAIIAPLIKQHRLIALLRESVVSDASQPLEAERT